MGIFKNIEDFNKTYNEDVKPDYQLLTFIMDGEEYAIDIFSVVEIRAWEAPTLLPGTPSYVKGVFNLRGVIIPIIDLRERMRLEKVDYTPLTVIIVLQVKVQQTYKKLGIIVDAVSDVYHVSETAIQAAPDLGPEEINKQIKGLLNIDDKMIILLDALNLLGIEELQELDGVDK